METLMNPSLAKPLFAGKNSHFFDACLYSGMGSVFADNQSRPYSAIAILGDYAVLGGQPSEALLADISAMRSDAYLILVGPDHRWNELIETAYGNRAKPFTRYALNKNEHGFNPTTLQNCIDSLQPGFALQPIKKELYHRCLAERWSKDLVALYPTYDRYAEYGLGFCVLKDGNIVSGASSYYFYEKGIELEVDTHPGYRKQGLATACCARLILSCLQRGLFPSWDAHTTTSLHLALKLGYHFSHAYTAYELNS